MSTPPINEVEFQTGIIALQEKIDVARIKHLDLLEKVKAGEAFFSTVEPSLRGLAALEDELSLLERRHKESGARN